MAVLGKAVWLKEMAHALLRNPVSPRPRPTWMKSYTRKLDGRRLSTTTTDLSSQVSKPQKHTTWSLCSFQIRLKTPNKRKHSSAALERLDIIRGPTHGTVIKSDANANANPKCSLVMPDGPAARQRGVWVTTMAMTSH